MPSLFYMLDDLRLANSPKWSVHWVPMVHGEFLNQIAEFSLLRCTGSCARIALLHICGLSRWNYVYMAEYLF